MNLSTVAELVYRKLPDILGLAATGESVEVLRCPPFPFGVALIDRKL
jgi:hypothetical protein